MKQFSPTMAVLGAGMALLASVGYVLLGPTDLFGFPEPRWAAFLFSPGTYVAVLTWEHVTHSLAACYVAGVATMTLIGGVLGAVLDFLLALGNPRPGT